MNAAFLSAYNLTPKRVEVLDSSMLGDFCDCPSMFYLKHILGLRPNRFDLAHNAGMEWGTAWHKGLYSYYHEYEKTGKPNLEAALQAVAEHYPSWLTPENDPKVKRSRDRMLKQLVAYHNHWDLDNSRYEILRREQFFHFFNEVDQLDWCGRMDSVRREKRTGKLLIWDYKTTSAMGERYFDQYELSFQFPGYVWAGNQMFTEEVLELKMDVMYTLSGSFDFFRRTFRYDAFRRREFVQNVKIWIDQIMYLQEHHLYEPEAWAKNYKECTRYSTCPFFAVHNVHPKGDTRLRMLQNDYREDRWDPSAIGE